MDLRLMIRGQIPSGKNAIVVTRTGMRFPKKRFKDWRKHALRELGPPPEVPYDGPVRMEVIYVRGDEIRRDMPGMLDAICHVLEKGGFLADDKHIRELEWVVGEADMPDIFDIPAVYIRLTPLGRPLPPPARPQGSRTPGRRRTSSPRRGRTKPQSTQRTD